MPFMTSAPCGRRGFLADEPPQQAKSWNLDARSNSPWKDDMKEYMEAVGMVAAVGLPLWNIPLIARIVKRRSSDDISLSWALGVWVFTLLMVPSGMISSDPVWRTFSVVNFLLFSGVVFTTLK